MTHSTHNAFSVQALPVIFEDEDLLVIDKPAGIVVNNSDTTAGEVTVQNLVEGKIEKTRKSEDSQFEKRGGIVHRLDKETSGVLIIAKNQKSFENLQAQFKERKVSKEYIALTHGQVKPEAGEINVPVGRLPWNRTRFGVLSGGRESRTLYNVLEGGGKGGEALTLVKLKPETGRTHQIRVHLKYIDHPIFSDPLYGGRKTSRNDRKILPRVFLHAYSISFNHPIKGERINLISPLPKELRNVLKMLKFKYGGEA